MQHHAIVTIEATLAKSSVRQDETPTKSTELNETENNPLLSTIPKILHNAMYYLLFERKNIYMLHYIICMLVWSILPDVLCVFLYKDVKSGHVILLCRRLRVSVIRDRSILLRLCIQSVCV